MQENGCAVARLGRRRLLRPELEALAVAVAEVGGDAGPLATDRPARNLAMGGNDAMMQRFCISRHGSSFRGTVTVSPGSKMPGAVNFVMVDGHVEAVGLDRLWFLTWHRGYRVPAQHP
jgi:prepilin-type processing-associated H-X9-DG protein